MITIDIDDEIAINKLKYFLSMLGLKSAKPSFTLNNAFKRFLKVRYENPPK